MLAVNLKENRIHVGERFSLAFQRTLRVPDDGSAWPLPAGFGPYPVYSTSEFRDRLPAEWIGADHFFISMYQREAMWIAFSAAAWKPNAVKIGVGGIDAISGLPFDEVLRGGDRQNYVVCPKQRWLDGLNSRKDHVTQFTAMPLGSGSTVEGQLTGAEKIGGIEIKVFEPKPGYFPDNPPPQPRTDALALAAPMGIAPGGVIEQKIYPDPWGVDVWDANNWAGVAVHILNSEQFQAVTGQNAPRTPIDARTYTERGLPWFRLYDEAQADLAPSEKLRQLKSVNEGG